MSYRLWIKSLPKKLGPWLRQPTSIAGIASVGVHLLMWVVLPILPLRSSEAEEPEIQRPVSLVELTPAEQGRLPDFSTSQIPIPQVPPATQVPPGSDFYSLTPLPNPYSSVPTQPSIPNYRAFPPIVLPQLPPAPQYTFRPPTRTTPRSPITTNIPPERPPETASPSPTPSALPSVEPGASALNPNVTEGQPNNPNLTQPSTQPSGTPADERIARLRQEQQRLRELYSFNGEGTGRGHGDRQSVEWFTQEIDGSPDDVDQIPLHVIEVAPPREACLGRLEERLPDEAWFGVVLNTNSEFVAQPSKLRSSGYEAFDRQALVAIAEYDFSQDSANDKSDYRTADGNRIYYVRVKFGQNLENCPSPAASRSNEG